MANPFSRTYRSLTAETSHVAHCAWAFLLVLLAGWLAWFLFIDITVYEVSAKARLEVEQAAHPVAPPISGKIVSTAVRIGKQVSAGEVLMELDAQTEQLHLQEEEARLRALPPQLAALNRQIEDQEQSASKENAAASNAIEQAKSRYREARAGARFAKDHAHRLSRMFKGQIAEIEVLRVRTDAAKSEAAAAALAADTNRLNAESVSKIQERKALIESLRREVAHIKGQMDTSIATIARYRHELEKHVIRAPIGGVIGEASPLDIGAYVDTGRVVASIVPTGKLKVIADFAPNRVLGRVYQGQVAQLRLDGFPWAQYGSIALVVDRVASEIRENQIRVEFIPAGNNDPLLLKHGLPGSVEIAIERMTPAVLALRAAGQVVAKPVSPNPSLSPNRS